MLGELSEMALTDHDDDDAEAISELADIARAKLLRISKEPEPQVTS